MLGSSQYAAAVSARISSGHDPTGIVGERFIDESLKGRQVETSLRYPFIARIGRLQE